METPDTEAAVRLYGDAVYRLAYALLRSRHDADDVFQEVFLRYHRAAPDFDSAAHQKAWLLRVTANCAKTALLSPWRRRNVPLEDVYTWEAPEESAVDSALASLPAKYRSVIHLYYYEGYSTEEIGRVLGRRPATVRSQLTRARRQLADILKEEES